MVSQVDQAMPANGAKPIGISSRVCALPVAAPADPRQGVPVMCVEVITADTACPALSLSLAVKGVRKSLGAINAALACIVLMDLFNVVIKQALAELASMGKIVVRDEAAGMVAAVEPADSAGSAFPGMRCVSPPARGADARGVNVLMTVLPGEHCNKNSLHGQCAILLLLAIRAMIGAFNSLAASRDLRLARN